MNSHKQTKRALLTSVMALVMCVVMLVGTTFAWFTDTATANVNTIKAGTLKVDIVDKNGDTLVGAEKFLKFIDMNGSENILWEPGVTFRTQEFKIKNGGNLALKWKMSVNGGITKDGSNASAFDLLDVITFSVVTKDSTGAFTATDIDTFEGHLNKEETSGEYYLQGTMDTSAGNDYQGLSLEGVTITVYATQDTVEYDSTTKDYDKDANVTLVTPETAAEVFSSAGGSHVRNASGTYVLTPGMYSLNTIEFYGTEPVTLIAEKGATFSSDNIAVTYWSMSYKDGDMWYTPAQKGSLTVTGFNSPNSVLRVTGDAPSITVKDNTVQALRLQIKDAAKDITVEGNTFSGNSVDGVNSNLYVVADTSDYDLTVKGNTFAGAGSHAIAVQGSKDGANNITVTGNTFNSYGANNKADRAAFKIWDDSKYAPNGTDPLNDAAKALANEVKTKNTFAENLGSNCIVADFYGKTVAFN